MLRWKQITEPKVIQVIEWMDLNDSLAEYNFLSVRNKDGKLHIEQDEVRIKSPEELTKRIDPKEFTIVLVTGSKVLNKPSNDAALIIEDQFYQGFPGSNLNEFVIQRSTYDDQSWLSIARSDYVHTIVERLNQKGVPVHEIRLGPFDISYLQGLLNVKSMPHFGYHDFSKEAYQFILNSHRSEQTSISDETIETANLPLFGAVLGRIIGKDDRILNEPAQVVESRSKWFDTKQLNTIKWAALLTLFALLLLNFFLFNNAQNKNQQLTGELSEFEGQQRTIQSQQDLEQSSMSYLSKHGWADQQKVSFYLDRLASTIPSSIRLTEIEIFPQEETRNNRTKTTLNDRSSIKVKGTANKLEDYNKWITGLTNLDWIEKVDVLDYSEESHIGEFVIHVHLK